MHRDAFEQLVSEWLDQPGRDDLRRRIDQAVAESPALAPVLDEWQRLDCLLRAARPWTQDIDWVRFRQRIAAGLDPEAVGARLDERLRALTDVESRVDWPRLRRRISRKVAGMGGRPEVVRIPYRRAVAQLALVGAAAALVVMLGLPSRRVPASPGLAEVRISSVATAPGFHHDRRTFARVTVSAPPDAGETRLGPGSSESGRLEPRLTEVFLIVGPARLAGEARAQMSPFGFN